MDVAIGQSVRIATLAGANLRRGRAQEVNCSIQYPSPVLHVCFAITPRDQSIATARLSKGLKDLGQEHEKVDSRTMANGQAERERLMGLIRDYIFEHGIVDLSLSRLARDIGSNNRMLIYYFESLDRILTSAIDDLLDDGQLMLTLTDHLYGKTPIRERLTTAWRQISSPDRLPYLRIYFARLGTASEHPDQHATFLAQTRERWVQAVEEALTDNDQISNPGHIAIAIVGLWRGLQVQLIAGDPVDVIDTVHDRVIEALVPEHLPVHIPTKPQA